MTAGPDRPCLHDNFAATVEVNRLTATDEPGAPVTAHAASIRVACTDCGSRSGG